jgi:PPM family protein phosphatase
LNVSYTLFRKHLLQSREEKYYMSEQKVLEAPVERSLAPFTFARATKAHAEHSESNRDALLTDAASLLAVVCDGVGDVPGARQAARLAAQTVKKRWRNLLANLVPGAEPDFEEMVRQLLEEANRAVLALDKKLLRKEQKTDPDITCCAATTIALALLHPRHNGYLMAYAHAGDSRIYLLRQGEPIRRLTVDDGYFTWKMGKGELNEQDALRIDQASRAEELTAEEREHFDKRNRISQSLWKEELELHLGQVELCQHDRILLCTDGIHDNLTDAELEEILRSGARTTVARKLLQRAIERSQQDENIFIRAKKDDMSAIVITCHCSPHQGI